MISGFVLSKGELDLPEGVRYAASFGDDKGLMAFDADEYGQVAELMRFGEVLVDAEPDMVNGPRRHAHDGPMWFTLLRPQDESANSLRDAVKADGHAAASVIDGEGLPLVLVQSRSAIDTSWGASEVWSAQVRDFIDARVRV